MRREDMAEFVAEINAAHDLKGAPHHSAQSMAMFFRLMEPFTLPQVKVAIQALMVNPDGGQYRTPIVPAHLVAQLQKIQEMDGRPSSDEAWSTAYLGFDESESIVATQETMAAMGVARPLIEAGDKVAARKAFMAAYDREVRTARQRGLKVKWIPSLGSDPDRRVAALEQAKTAGLLPPPTVAGLIGRPEVEEDYDAEVAERNLAKLKSMVANIPTLADKAAEASEAARARQKELLDAHNQKVKQIQQETGK